MKTEGRDSSLHFIIALSVIFTTAIALSSSHNTQLSIGPIFVSILSSPFIFFTAFGLLTVVSLTVWIIELLRAHFAASYLAGLITLLFISMLLRDTPAFGNYMQWQFGGSLLLASLLVILLATRSNRSFTIKTFQWCCFLPCFASLAFVPGDYFFHGPGSMRFMGIFDNPNLLGLYGFVSAAKGLFTFATSSFICPNLRSTRWFFCNISVSLICIVLSGSRSALFCLFLAGMMFSIVLFRDSRSCNPPILKSWARKLWAPLLATLIAAILLQANRFEQLVNSSDDSVNNRSDTLRAGWQMLIDMPAGVGFNNVLSRFEAHYNSPFMPQGAAVMRNDWFVIMASYGICPGLVAFLVLFCGPLLALARRVYESKVNSPPAHRQMSVQFAILLLCVCVFAAINSVIFTLPASCLFWSLAAIWVVSDDHDKLPV